VISRFRFAAIAITLSLPLVPGASAQSADGDPPAAAMSKIRIVRLSEVRGTVQLDRSTGRGFEPAMANLPVVEKNRLRTGQGVAEVEFEDNSTLRLAPDSDVEFSELERKAEGPTISTVHLLRGTAYVSLVKSRANEFNLVFDSRTAVLPPGSHVRLEASDATASLAVIDGNAHVDGPDGPVEIAHKETVLFHLVDQGQPTVEHTVVSDAYDSWDKDATGYHARTASMSALSGAPYSYGLNDMMYYGNFTNAGGCGQMWQPFFASAGWEPYSNGAWAFYPGAGYSWVSPYPWGWTPYHYGTWSFCPGTGWGWQPGGTWNGLNNVAASSGSGPFRFRPPSSPPGAGQPTLTVAGTKPLVRSEVASADSFVFRQDSAGLGIPRETLGKLDKLSRQAAEHGSSSTHIYLSVPVSTRSGGPSVALTSIHRGYAENSAELASPRGPAMAPSSAPSSGSPAMSHPSASSGHTK
jgi:FecR protein